MLLYSVWRSMAVRALGSLVGLLLVLAPLASCNTPTPPAVQFVPIDLGIPDAALKSPVIGNVPDNTMMHVRITLKMNPDWLKRMEQQKIQPGQRSHLENFANKLGIDDATYQKIRAFFNTQGIAVKMSKLRTNLAMEAKASTIGKLLQVKFVNHKYQDRTFFAPDAQPKVPQFLANSIDAITGLDNYSAPPIHDFTLQLQEHTHHYKPGQADCSPADQTLTPRDVAGAYGYDQLWNRGLNGENMTVNLVEIDAAYRDDVQNYFDCINFKGHLNVVNVDGSPSQAVGESTLDVQMVAGLARAVNINLYQTDANSSDDVWVNVNDELQQIINDNTNNGNDGNVVSISLGASEGEMSSSDARAIDSSLQQLTRVEHMTVFVASGDCGAFTSGAYGQLSVSFPASDPWSTAVGGTMLSVDGNRRRANEVVWSDGSRRSSCKNRWGSGGGNSGIFGTPSWQNAAGVKNNYSRGRRQLPDVSAVAFALAVYFQGQWGSVGGTSAAAPIWAAGEVLMNEGLMRTIHKFGYSPQLYYFIANKSSGKQPYYDVTRGNNLYYPATPGWDFATGLGTPNLANFYDEASSVMI